mmetsp:Transcript_69001/g.133149  ORF Transcript_69001/g.133149 Transcript_69001/m.133149 type:complete len:228 (-) Transcript_69001:127-810(-)
MALGEMSVEEPQDSEEEALQPTPKNSKTLAQLRFRHLGLFTMAVLVSASLLVARASNASWRKATLSSQLTQKLRPQQLWLPNIRFQMIGYGDCTSVGWVAVKTKEGCEQASKHLGLSDQTVSVTAEVPRPFGCYFFHNAQDNTSSLWLSINETNAGSGATSGKRWQRQLICQAQEVQFPTSTSSTATMTMTTTSHTTLNAQMILQAAEDELALGPSYAKPGSGCHDP